MLLTRSLVATSWLLLLFNSCSEDQLAAPAVAGDGPILLSSERAGNLDLYIMRSDGSVSRYLTRNPAVDRSADWCPDDYGFRIAFMSDRDGDFEVFTMPVSGRWVQQLTDNAARDGLPQWSPDGSQILFTSNRDGNYELYADSPGTPGMTSAVTGRPTVRGLRLLRSATGTVRSTSCGRTARTSSGSRRLQDCVLRVSRRQCRDLCGQRGRHERDSTHASSSEGSVSDVVSRRTAGRVHKRP
jgi:hypothetical protein